MISVSFDDGVKIGLQFVLDSLHLCSPYGQERIGKLRFYAPCEKDALERELGNVARCAACADGLKDVFERTMAVLCQMKDIRQSLRRIRGGECPDEVELFEIKSYLLRIGELRPLLEEIRRLAAVEELAFHDPAPALAVLDPEHTRSRGFFIPDGATEELGRIRREKKEVEQQLHQAQTAAEQDELRLRRARICAAEESEEMKVRRAMGVRIAPLAEDLLSDAETVGALDFLIQKALFAARFGGVKPELTDTALELEDMVNPELSELLAEKGRAFVPVSIALDRGAAVITGANMGGKSVALKTLALNVLLCHAGFLACAKEARIPLFHCVKMLFDDLQSMQSGLSGFGSEIVSFEKALHEVEQGYSLFLLDEFARGTNPDEGAVIVQAVTRYLGGKNAVSVLTTHYDRVAEYADIHYQIIGLRDVDPSQIRAELSATGQDGVAVIARHMNYGLYRVEGRADCPRDALNICRMLSLRQEILEQIEKAY